MDAQRLRAWWSHRQGLDGRFQGAAPAKVLAETGWARSVGGSGPYLGLHARCGADRAAVDEAVAKLAIHELPSARGCTYVVPAEHFALALKAGEGFSFAADMRVAEKLGVTRAEIDRLCEAILDALKKEPLDPDALRAATGGAARSLGDAGKKKGLTTTLPLALGRLQEEGKIRRIPTNGRLDQQRYRYAIWRPSPLSKFRASREEAFTELARLFFNWIAPASVAEFQAFAALGVKAAQAAVEPLKLKAVETGSELLMLPGQHEALAAYKRPKDAQYVLVSSIDGLLLLRHNVADLLDADDAGKKLAGEKGLLEARGVQELPNHAIFDRGRLVGVWEYDPESESIAWTSFIRPNTDLKGAVRRTEDFIRTSLGDARSFSLDSPKSRKPRIEALRKMSA